MATSRRAGSGTACSASSGADPGERAVRFLNNLQHTGDFAGEPFRLRPWQEAPIRKLFGTTRPDGRRRYRKTFWALPRKQGKTELVAGSALYLMMGQGKPNRRIYTAAGDTKQAALIFGAACDMIRADPVLDARTVIYKSYRRIEYPEGESTLEVLSSVPRSKHGLGPTDVLIDEYHVVDEELINVLVTGFAARREPLLWMITTAGCNRFSACYREWQYALRVRDDPSIDPEYLPIIYAADPGDDWQDEATWFKAMPALGDFCDLDFIRSEFRSAKERPGEENRVRNLYLNQWVEQAVRWISPDAWDACRAEVVEADYEGRECYAGLDLSSKHDLTALALAFPNDRGGYDLLLYFWLPGESIDARVKSDKVEYDVWVRQGFIEKTEGARIDYDAIRDRIEDLATRFEILGLAFDPQFAGQLANQLHRNGNGLPVIETPNNHTNLNPAALEFERLVAEQKLAHPGNPVMDWCVDNVAITKRLEMILPSKAKSNERIDGVMAAVMALAAALKDDDRGEVDSVYDDRGITFLDRRRGW